MMSNLQQLQERLAKRVCICLNKSFAQLTTIGCGGEIAIVAYPTTIRQFRLCLRWAKRLSVPHLVLGRGSNLLASDDKFLGLVICTTRLSKVRRFATTVWCQCGASTARIAKYCAARGLTGAEFWYCLPASVGGAVVMNAGCFGADTSSIVSRVYYLEGTRLCSISGRQCRFGKRTSLFKQSDKVVVAAKLRLGRGNSKAIRARCKAMMAKKRLTQPLGQKTFGSAFFNDSGTASRLIDQAGLKNFRIGDAKVSNLHAGFVINIDKATSFDIYLLLRHVQSQVYLRFGEILSLEVQTTGFFEETNDLGRLPHSH
ncbi:MAG: UDP-N-acetylmuramate dehydrogenase [Clostridia bacterium]|nr:UDP-N-acetylmuramate dehydrogenase [Clostridia bacterium]